MSRITIPTATDGPADSRPLIAALAQKFGRAPNLFATIGHSPAVLSSLLGDGRLVSRRAERERDRGHQPARV
ncbi:MAG TPA: hypothetical protein PK095_05460 [Myxococcota bacterium]|nr:hypothetical protein [Myxococcota bacterium]